MSISKPTTAALALWLAGTAFASAESLQVANDSSRTIMHLFLSDADDNDWGPDQLGDGADDTVMPGESFTLTNIEQGRYDIKLVTKSGAECEVNDVVFDSSYEWTITNGMLKDC
ncbi:MAG: hypothetical protein JOZ72_16125 [Alphaproteobacteria bacterium]|nr:hypothetical protein [Alphaproteobacteria bacterium]